MKSKPTFPEIEVQLSGTDGNAFMLIGKVLKALRRAGVSDTNMEQFEKQATSGDYQYLLQVCREWVTVK